MRSRVPLLALALAGCAGGPGVDSVDESLMVCAKGAVTHGVDVSHYDGTIDWATVHANGIDFAIIKATENVNFIDPQFAANWKGAGANGVLRGAYHFLRPEIDGAMQADYFLANGGTPGPGDLPPTLDLEVTDNLTAAQVASSALAFLQRVAQKTGRVPIVYTSQSFFGGTLGSPSGFGGYTLWVANWTTGCPTIPSPGWSDWSFWQNSSTGTVKGITGMSNVDLDDFNGTLAQLQGFVGGAPSDGGAGDGGALPGAPDGGASDGGNSGGAAPDFGHAPINFTARGGCATTPANPSDLGLLVVALALLLLRRGAKPRI
jgi:lysozyme